MRRINRPVELIRYASQNGIERGQKLRFTPRLAGYSAVLIALIGVWFVLVFSRSDVETTLLRAPGALFQQMPDGRLSNLYTVKVINKTSRPVPVSLRLASPEGSLQVMGGSRDILVAPEKLAQTSVLIELSRDQLAHGQAKLEIGVYSGARKIQQLKTAFLGPRDDSTRESEPK
jgi:polyferredoxin